MPTPKTNSTTAKRTASAKPAKKNASRGIPKIDPGPKNHLSESDRSAAKPAPAKERIYNNVKDKLGTDRDQACKPLKTQEPAVEPARKREFTVAEEKIIDTVADMLTHGCREENMAALVKVTVNHYRRRVNSDLGEITEEDRRAFERNEGEWLDNLKSVARMNRRLPKPEQPEPRDISERIHAQYIDRLANSFEQFLVEASAEEVRLMQEILDRADHWEGCRQIDHAVALATAFEDVLVNGEGKFDYVKVPRYYSTRINEYIKVMDLVEWKRNL